MSATSASRARTPFPTLSSKRAASTTPAVGAMANSGFVSAPSAYPNTASPLRLPR
jgi:hypothetical protein